MLHPTWATSITIHVTTSIKTNITDDNQNRQTDGGIQCITPLNHILSLADTSRQSCQGWNIEGSCCSVTQVDLWPEGHGNLRFSKLHFDHNQENKTHSQCPQCLPHRPCQAPSACRVWTLRHWKIGKKGFCHADILIGKIGLEAGLIAWLFLPSLDWMWCCNNPRRKERKKWTSEMKRGWWWCVLTSQCHLHQGLQLPNLRK